MKFATMRRSAAAVMTAGAATLGAAAVLLASGAGAARAQDAAPHMAAHPFSLKIGDWIPSNGDTRSALGYSIVSFGAGYDIKHTSTTLPNVTEIYADYFARPKTTNGVRNDAELYGIGIADRIYMTPHHEDIRYYLGAGAGIYHVRATASEAGTSIHEYKTSLGGKFLAGAQVKGGVFLEVSYNFVPEPKLAGQKVHLSGTNISLGYRF